MSLEDAASFAVFLYCQAAIQAAQDAQEGYGVKIVITVEVPDGSTVEGNGDQAEKIAATDTPTAPPYSAKPTYSAPVDSPLPNATGKLIQVGDAVRSNDGLEWTVSRTWPYENRTPRVGLYPTEETAAKWSGNAEQGTQRPQTLTVIDCPHN